MTGVAPFYFLDEQIGFYYSGGLYKTIDGGDNFEWVSVGLWPHFVDIFAIDENSIWGILLPLLDGDGSSRGIAKISSTDSENYSEIITLENNPEIDMYSIHFADETTGYIVGYKNGKGAIWKNGTGINVLNNNENDLSENIKIYPNPTTNEINVSFDNTFSGILILTDLTGKQIHSSNFTNKNNIVIDVKNFPKGTYILSIKSQNNNFTKKIIIH